MDWIINIIICIGIFVVNLIATEIEIHSIKIK